MNRPDHVYKWTRHVGRGNWRWRLPRWMRWEMPWEHFKRIWCHEKERVNQGYSWYDWISFDTHICQVIADACADFRLKGAGYPSGMTEKEWHDILYRIEVPLRWWAEQKFENDLEPKAEMIKYKEAQAAMALFSEHLGSMWD